MSKFEKGQSGNPRGRSPGSKSRVPTENEISRCLKRGSHDAVDVLIDLLKDKDGDEKYRAAAAIKIADEAYKLLKSGTKFTKNDVRRRLVVYLEEALLEIEVLMKTAEDRGIQIRAASNILKKALDEVLIEDSKKASEELQDLLGQRSNKVVPILKLSASD